MQINAFFILLKNHNSWIFSTTNYAYYCAYILQMTVIVCSLIVNENKG